MYEFHTIMCVQYVWVVGLCAKQCMQIIELHTQIVLYTVQHIDSVYSEMMMRRGVLVYGDVQGDAVNISHTLI